MISTGCPWEAHLQAAGKWECGEKPPNRSQQLIGQQRKQQTRTRERTKFCEICANLWLSTPYSPRRNHEDRFPPTSIQREPERDSNALSSVIGGSKSRILGYWGIGRVRRPLKRIS